MKKSACLTAWTKPLSILILIIMLMVPTSASATSQWARKTGMSCNACHTVFPRLNSFGEKFLRNGYLLMPAHKKKTEAEYADGGVFLDKVGNLFGMRLNMTPIQLETNSFQKDATSEKTTRITLGNPLWIQFFVAGSIYNNISFFSELQYERDSFHFSWFYFNFTNLSGSRALNFSVGNLPPMQFTSYPNRLRILPAIKSEVMRIKSSNGAGEESIDMSSVRPGLQYYGWNDWVLVYAGASPGTEPRNVNQFLHYWTGITLKMPDDILEGFEGSTATIHYYRGTDTDNTGGLSQIENKFRRISPQINIRYNENWDLQAALVFAKDDNWDLVASPMRAFKYSGVAITGAYTMDNWQFGLHYDEYSSDDKLPTGEPVLDFQRIVPVISYIINQNIRLGFYYEKDLLDQPPGEKVDKIFLNVRTMF